MLRLYINVLEHLQFNTELSLKNVENALGVLLLWFSETHFVLIVCIFALSEADLIILKNSEKFFSHVVLQSSIMGSSHTFSQEVVLQNDDISLKK